MNLKKLSARLWAALGYASASAAWEEVPELLPGGRSVEALATLDVIAPVERPVAV
jgi:hypothetical protein